METQDEKLILKQVEIIEKKCEQPDYAPDKNDLLMIAAVTKTMTKVSKQLDVQYKVALERITLLAKENEKLRDELDRAKNLGFK